MNRDRKLTYRFLELPHVYRMEIVQSMGIVQEKNVKDDELYVRMFIKARDEGRLAQLWEEIEKRHEDGNPNENPFKGE